MIDENNITFVNPPYILIINDNGKLKKVSFPFEVQTIYPTSAHPISARMWVEDVHLGFDGMLIYIINQGHYFHWHFRIV